MADLQTDVRYIRGIGETRAKALAKLGIYTLADLIGYFPRGYEDRTLTRPIRELVVGESACVRAMVAGDPTAARISGGRTIVKAGQWMKVVCWNWYFSIRNTGKTICTGDRPTFFTAGWREILPGGK